MITERLANKALAISDNAKFSNKYLVPLAGTPLSALVSSINAIVESGDVNEIVSISQRKTSTIGSFNEIEDEIAKSAGKILSRVIFKARNEINPKIKGCIDKVEEYKKTAKGNLGYILPTINMVEIEQLYLDDMFISLLQPYGQVNYKINNDILHEAMELVCKSLTDDELLAVIKTGSSGVDKKTLKLLENNSTLNVKNLLEGCLYSCDVMTMSAAELTIAFLLLEGISLARLEKLNFVIDSSIWLAEITNLKANVASRLTTVINRLSKTANEGGIIVPVGIMKPNYRSINVFTNNYREWIASKGGSVEAIMGYYLYMESVQQQLNEFNIKAVIDDPQRFVNEYNMAIRYNQSINLTDELVRVPAIISEYLSDCVNKSEMETNEKIANINKIVNATKRPYYTNEELISYCRDVVCEVYCDCDDVKQVLTNIDSVLKESGKDNMDYAVYVSLSRLVGRWLAKQIEVKSGV